MVFIILQVLVAWIYSHFLEYFLHKYLLHNPKRKKWFKTHFADHHRVSRKLLMIDPKYLSGLRIQGDPELKGLILLAFLHFPIALFFPYAYFALIVCSLNYWYIHSRSHRDINWSRENTPWHYDHHLGKNQNANWGVRLPMIDYLFGTRVLYKGTKKEIIKYHLIKSKMEQIINSKRMENK